MKDKNTESENKKSQAIYDSMPTELQQKMDDKMAMLKEKAKTNPLIAKMFEKK